MTKKGTLRLIRKRIAQRKAKNNAKHNTKSNNQQNQNTNNSIRSQMMNIAAQNIANGLRPFGYASQQYGNINNERRIEQLRNDAQTKSSEIQNNHAIIETFQKQINELSADTKKMKKMIKEKQTEFDKTKHEKEMMSDKLNEAERIERDNIRLGEQTRILERQYAEVDKDSHIADLKKTRLNLTNQIQKNELDLIEKQKQIESNTLYNEHAKLQNELDAIIAKNASYDKILQSEDFRKPNAEYIEKSKKLAIEKEKLRQKEELYKLELENKQQEEALAAQPSKEDLAAITQQFANDRIKANKRAIELKKQMTDTQDNIDMLSYQHEQYMKARKDEVEQQHNLDMLRKENIYLNEQLKKNNDNQRYKEQIEKTANIRAKGLRKAMVVKMKQDLLQQKHENDILEKVAELNNGNPTKDEITISKSIGETKARNSALQTQQQLNNDLHASTLRTIEEKANNDFHNSEEYQNLLKANADIKTQTQNNLNRADAMKVFNEHQKHLNDSRISYTVSSQLRGMVDSTTDIQQVDHLITKADELLQSMTTKENIKSDLLKKVNSFPEKWKEFVKNPKYETVIEKLDNENTEIDVLRDIYNTFINYLRPQQQQISSLEESLKESTIELPQEFMNDDPNEFID